MVYSDFTLKEVTHRFRLHTEENPDVFSEVPEGEVSALLQSLLQVYVPLALAIHTEKARSEFMIAPLLAEVLTHAPCPVSLFSGVDFPVAPEQGLNGVCDFLISLSAEQLFITAPIVVIVEAKNENLKGALGQCAAEMVAAQLFNERERHPIPTLFGVATTGSLWQFLKLHGKTLTIDRRIAKILGILMWMIRTAMAYNDFTLDTLIAQFSLQVQEESNYFTPFAPLSMSDLLRQTLQENVPLALDISTEKARSEFIIAPVLLEVRRQLDHRISLFSGVEFNVNPEQGLRGVCDFLLSLSPLQLTIQAPVIMVVEAKNENVKQGISQCIAEMLAAQQFNQERNSAIETVYGVVTTGSAWKFLRLTRTSVMVDATEYHISQVERVVGILVAMIKEAAGGV